MAKAEMLRRLLLGNLRTLFRHRYGTELPDDDAGREDLRELLRVISRGPKPTEMMTNAIQVWASWMSASEAEQTTDTINREPIWERLSKAEALSERLRVTNAERELLSLWQLVACDLTQEERTEHKKAKARARMKLYRQKQRETGRKPSRAEYEANSLSRTKPWEAEGFNCRRTWERHRAKTRKASTKPKLSVVASTVRGATNPNVDTLTRVCRRCRAR